MQHSSGVIGKPDTVRPAKHNGGNIAGMYDLEQTLGKGHFAVVKMARHVFTGEQVAVKVIDKNKLEEVSRNHLYQEVSAIGLYSCCSRVFLRMYGPDTVLCRDIAIDIVIA